MLTVIIKRTVSRLDLRNLYVSVACNNYILRTKRYRSKELILPSITSKGNIIYRNFSQKEIEKKERKEILPQLIPGPIITTYSIFNTIKMRFLQSFIVALINDTDFKLRDIMDSAKKAASVVSIALSNKDYNSLYNLIDSTVLEILKRKVDTLTEEQRKLIAMTEESIFLCFPYNLSCVINSEDSITVILELVIHYAPGIDLKDILSKSKFIQFTRIENKCVSNYTFTRDYVRGRNTYWIITHLNHCQAD
ncbi:uncharacterized protein V1478_018430 [Vespula squamosa]|uniref:Tim44-like domain-containing protein n=1 Tax=Vespula squamosa TaxID=30214 RepID=A0ABD1ZXF1_VESSQ